MMSLPGNRLSRRALAGLGAALLPANSSASVQVESLRYQLPMGVEGALPGDRCYIRHGFDCENTGFNTGWWHTGENWYTNEGNSAGALIYAVADGEVVYADADYPGRVVIIAHPDGLFSMYGHLDYELLVSVGDSVTCGQVIGTVLLRTDTRSPSHLHFEIRTFLLNAEVNGNTPRYALPCGRNCPPGPGYWPMSDGQLPTDLGWLNPTHVIGRSAFKAASSSIVAAEPLQHSVSVWSMPGDRAGAALLGEIELVPGEQWPLLDRSVGRDNTSATSADAYRIWVKTHLENDGEGWLPALSASSETTGTDGRPSAVRFNFLPVL